jgi:hypothetical protein
MFSFFLTCHVCNCFSSFCVWNIHLSIFCNAGLMDVNHFSLSLSWKISFLLLDGRIALLDIAFLVCCYFLSELGLCGYRLS